MPPCRGSHCTISYTTVMVAICGGGRALFSYCGILAEGETGELIQAQCSSREGSAQNRLRYDCLLVNTKPVKRKEHTIDVKERASVEYLYLFILLLDQIHLLWKERWSLSVGTLCRNDPPVSSPQAKKGRRGVLTASFGASHRSSPGR